MSTNKIKEEKCCEKCWFNRPHLSLPGHEGEFCEFPSCSCHNSEKEWCPCSENIEKGKCEHTPKVATSEKECEHNNPGIALNIDGTGGMWCKDCGVKYPTPHESEDWEVELQFGIMEDYLTHAELKSFAKNSVEHMEEMRESWEKLKDFIRKEKSKAYQRGREEGESEEWEELRMLFYMRPQSLSNAEFYWGKAKNIIETLSSKVYQRGREEGEAEGYKRGLEMALQEIEKEKREAKTVSQFMKPDKFNEGLDKAKSIISNLKR